jgi:hypothetical protein
VALYTVQYLDSQSKWHYLENEISRSAKWFLTEEAAVRYLLNRDPANDPWKHTGRYRVLRGGAVVLTLARGPA